MKNISKLKEGMVIKNYKELCKILKKKPKGGNTKKKQLEIWKMYFEFEKEKYSYIITKIYELKEVQYNMAKYKALKKFNNCEYQRKQFNIKYEHYFKGGIYKITLDNKIYIGSTKSFYRRYRSHWDKSNSLQTLQMLKSGAVFEKLWLLPKEFKNNQWERNKILIQKEREFVDKYKEKENIILVNKTIPKFKNSKNKQNKNKMRINKYRHIKVYKEDYEKLMKLIEEYNIRLKGD